MNVSSVGSLQRPASSYAVTVIYMAPTKKMRAHLAQQPTATPEQRLQWKLDEAEDKVSRLEDEVRELKGQVSGMQWQVDRGQEIYQAVQVFKKVFDFADKDHDHDGRYEQREYESYGY